MSLSEKAFMQQVIALARPRGWLAYHTFDSRRSTAGFPDLVLVRGSRAVFVELKARRGRVTVPQQAWLQALARVERVTAHLWRPDDWPQIEEVLR